MNESLDGSRRGATEGSRALGAARANLGGALGMVWATFGAPGSVLLTLFLKEWLHAEKWQIGLVLTLTYLGPTFEPFGAYLVERYGRRRLLFLGTYLFNRLLFFVPALIPLFGDSDEYRARGIVLVLLVVGVTRVASHLGTPAWWSWMADLVPERRRARFFGCRTQASSAVQALSFVTGMTLLQTCGGMGNAALVSALFAAGALFGTLDILLYFGVPEPAHRTALTALGLRQFLASFGEPFRCPAFRRLLLGMGLWSFSANLVLPFLPVYQRGEVVAGQPQGLHLSWLYLATLNVLSCTAAALTSRFWGRWAERLGTRGLTLLSSGYLFINLVYLVVRPGDGLWLLFPVALAGGALNAAWTVCNHQHLLNVAPRQNRSFYVSAHNFVNGWLMAGGPLLGGLLADHWPGGAEGLPGGWVTCYFHALLLLATLGGLAALVLLAGVTEPRAAPGKGTGVFRIGLWSRRRAPVDKAGELAKV